MEEQVGALLCASLVLSLCGCGGALALVVFTVWGLAETSNDDVVSACGSGGAASFCLPLSHTPPLAAAVWWFTIVMLLCGGCSFAGCRQAAEAPTAGAAGCCLLCGASVLAAVVAVVQAYADPNGDCVESHFGDTKLLHTAKAWWWIVVLSAGLQAAAGLLYCCLWAMEGEPPPSRRVASVEMMAEP